MPIPEIGLLTVIGPELTAMKIVLDVTEEDRVAGQGSLAYEMTVQNRHSGPLRVHLHVIGEPGNAASAVDTTRIITPNIRFMILCGIAAGMRGKVRIGDLIVPRAVVNATLKVADHDGLKPRPSIHKPLKGVLQMNAAVQVDSAAWQELFLDRFKTKLTIPRGKKRDYAKHVARIPAVHESALLSDNLLLKNSAILADAANDLHQQIRAGEMEAAGFIQACETVYPPVPWYVIRGVSDFGDELKNDQFHSLASFAVASYTRLYLETVLDVRIWDPRN